MLALRLARAPLRTFSTSSLRLTEKAALEVRLRDGLKTAMKAKDRAAVSVLKAIIADVTYAQKSGANPNDAASQEAVITAIKRGIEKRVSRRSALYDARLAEFSDRNRVDFQKAAAESYAPGSPSAHEGNYSELMNEISLLSGYMPTAPTPEAVQAAIDEIVAGLDAEVRASKGATGAVMRALWEKLGDARAAVDKKDVAARVGKALK